MTAKNEFTKEQEEVIRQMIREEIRKDWGRLNFDIGYGIRVKKSPKNARVSHPITKSRSHRP